jgi:hypothetical protein
MGDFDAIGFFKKIYKPNVKQIQAQVTSILFSRTIILCCQTAMNFNSSSQHATTVTNTSCDYTESKVKCDKKMMEVPRHN